MTTVLIGEKGKKLRIVRQNVTMTDLRLKKRIVSIPDALAHHTIIIQYNLDGYDVFTGATNPGALGQKPYYSVNDNFAWACWSMRDRHRPRMVVFVQNGVPVDVPPRTLLTSLRQCIDQNDPTYRVLKTRLTHDRDTVDFYI